MARITDDVTWEIMLQLPAKSILGFRTVCKSWLKMIQNPVFIKAQVEQATRINTIDNRLIVIPGSDETASLKKHHRHTLYSVVFHSQKNLNTASLKKLDNPSRDRKSRVSLVGTCNGLICLENTNNLVDHMKSGFGSRSSDVFFSLWNPCTGIRRIVADESNIPLTSHWSNSYCYFVYDSLKDDYHVVRVTMPPAKIRGRANIPPADVRQWFILDVYSLKTNSWTKIDNQDKLQNEWIITVDSGVFVSGTLYLVSKQRENSFHHMIIAFNIATPSFRLVELPPQYDVGSLGPLESILGELHGGRLSIMENTLLYKTNHRVWWLDDNQNEGKEEESWWPVEIETSKPMCFTKLLPYSIASEQVLGLFNEGQISWCDFKTEKTRDISVQIPSEYHLYQRQPYNYLVGRKACVCLKTIASPYSCLVPF